MPPRKQKSRKSKPKIRTARRRITSVMGKIFPPLDIKSSSHLRDFEKIIKTGGLTVILVYAPWCHHCHTLMPHFDAAAAADKRSIQVVKVKDDMLPLVNKTLTSRVNSSAQPINVEGYPSIIVVDNQGNQVTNINPVNDTKVMTKLMTQAAEPSSVRAPSARPLSAMPLSAMPLSARTLSARTLSARPSSVRPPSARPVSTKVKSADIIVPSSAIKSSKPTPIIELPPSTSMPLNIQNMASTKPLSTSKDLQKSAEEVTSLSGLLTPPSNHREDVEEGLKKGGNHKGGSLYSSLIRASYALAPASAILASAAIVMKNTRKSKTKKYKKSKKTRRH